VTESIVPRLAVHDSNGRRVVSIDQPVFTIGRGAGHDLQLAGPGVSRDHAEIVLTNGAYVVRDRDSRYGTFVNGHQVSEKALSDGDRIELGRTGAVLLFLSATRGRDDRDEAPRVGDLRQVATLLDSLREMGTDRVLDEVLVLVLDSAIEATGAERGFIMLADDDDALKMTLARSAGRITLPSTGFETSRKIPEEVFTSGRIMVVTDLLENGLAEVHTGTVALGIRQVLCAPLRLVRYVDRRDATTRDRNIGVLYLDSRERGRLLSPSARAALEALATQAALAIENARLYKQGLEKARLDDELRIASRIQQALLPEARRTGTFFDVVGASIPSRTIGGDFFDYQMFADGRFGFGLGDITGKGPAAALVTALVQGVLATCALAFTAPDESIGIVNRVMHSRRIEARYLTLFLAVLAPDGRLTYCNAGHNPPLLLGAEAMRRLETGGTIVGAFPAPKFERETVQLGDGDTLVVYSDGVSEALSQAGEEFAEERIREVIARSLHLPVEGVLTALLEAVRRFAGDVAPQDDLTALVLRYRGPR
jgi:serine phosphatase RsbU (regulator of sigma subunit)/pSer/pThr/pTyr-binding forkhead associated (FHA) protein